MEKYYNLDFKDAIRSIQVKQGTSKEGSPYTYIELSFINNYSKRIFMNDEMKFAIFNSIDTMMASGNKEAENEEARKEFWNK